MPLQHFCTRDIAWHVSTAAESFIVQQWENPVLPGPYKVLFQNQGIIWEMSLTHENLPDWTT